MALAYDETSIRDAMLNLITTRAGASALLRLYDGTRPSTDGTATNLLTELACSVTFASAASGGVLTVNQIASDTSPSASGTATWFRIVKSDGTTFVLDGDVSAEAPTDLLIGSTSILTGSTVSVDAFTITEGNG